MSSHVSPAQIRAARGLLGWSQNDLAEASGLSRRTIASIELGEEATQLVELKIRHAFTDRLVLFTRDENHEGVSRRILPLGRL